MAKGPGRSDREGLTLLQLYETFPDEEAAHAWFESRRWPDGVECPRCGSGAVSAIKSLKPMPWRCRACRRHFSVRTGTVMAESKLPLRKWAVAVYLWTTSLKGVSSMKLHRDLGITQKSAWFLGHRLREASKSGGPLFAGPVEVDETFLGGKRKNMPKRKRAEAKKTLGEGGTAGKTVVAGAKDRDTKRVSARVVKAATRHDLRRFMEVRVRPDATIYTDGSNVYDNSPYAHEAVNHSAEEARPRPRPHQRDRELLGAAQASLPGDVPPLLPEAHRPLRGGVRPAAQPATSGRHGGRRLGDGRAEADARRVSERLKIGDCIVKLTSALILRSTVRPGGHMPRRC